MKQFVIIMGDENTFDYYTCVVSDDVSNNKIVDMVKNLHPKIFRKQERQKILNQKMQLIGIVNISTFTKVPIVIMLYPDTSNDRFERALNILLDAAGIQ